MDLNKIYNEDCLIGMKRIPDGSVDLVVTSPPYALQRKNQYGGVNEADYPNWTAEYMRVLRPKLSKGASVFINIRPHLKNGVISDYTLKTRLALREDGWYENEEIIWIKPDSPPLGSTKRPRRSWESIHWFSMSRQPYCDTKANGVESDRIGFENDKHEHGGSSHIHAGQNKSKKGISRSRDYIEVGTGKVEKNVSHPAMFPVQVPEHLIRMCSKNEGVVLDPFMGSGTTAIACMNTERNFIGFELDKTYYEKSLERIKNHITQTSLFDHI